VLERDKIDAFLERLEGIPGLDYEVEGIVDRSTACSAASGRRTRRRCARGS